jgi:hypothetical protein
MTTYVYEFSAGDDDQPGRLGDTMVARSPFAITDRDGVGEPVRVPVTRPEAGRAAGTA